MTSLFIIISFIGGFYFGKRYIVQGLSLRVEQLYEEGDPEMADFIRLILQRK